MRTFKKAALVVNLTLILGLITPLSTVAQASSSAPSSATTTTANPVGSASVVTPYAIPAGHLNITLEDLKFMLDQIKIGEAHSDRTAAGAPAVVTLPYGPNPSLNYGAAGSSPVLVYPYDVTSKDRCLIASDITTAATVAYGPTGLSNNYVYANTSPWGVRQVDGQCNNITNVKAEVPTTGATGSPVVPQPSTTVGDTGAWGAGDQLFSRLTPAATGAAVGSTPANGTQVAYSDPASFIAGASPSIVDPAPRIISDLISDQSAANPAALAAATQAVGILYGSGTPQTETAVNAQTGAPTTVYQIPNITPDYNVSAGYNSWFTLFGQFFDHGLDLIPKAGAQVLIPLQVEDSLYSTNPGAQNQMILTRGTDSTGNAINITTPYIDQSQTYGSHPSQNFFLREYTFAAGANGLPSFTGRLLDGTTSTYGAVTPVAVDLTKTTKAAAILDVMAKSYKPQLPAAWTGATPGGTLNQTTSGAASGTNYSNQGLATWKEIKAQAYLLGISLTDWDAESIPVIATDQYGKFIPAPTGAATVHGVAGSATGFPMMLFSDSTGNFMWQAGTPTDPIATVMAISGVTWTAVSSGHPFINDTMSAAVPYKSSGAVLYADGDSVMNGAQAYSYGSSYYDNETLDAHFVAGDGRVNENIGLSAIHYTFHAEHNTLITDIKGVIGTSPSDLFQSEWTPERLYQAARMTNEMEYQHMAFDEFIRRLSVGLPLFAAYDPNINANISQEFASAVYRLGHSMLNETIARSNPGSSYDPADNQDVSLLTGFTNPAQARLVRPAVIASAAVSGSSIVYTLASGEVLPPAGSVVTITGMDVPAYNVVSGIVVSPVGSTFTITNHYVIGSASSYVGISVPGTGTSLGTIYPVGGPSIARVTINDPGAAGYDYTPAESAASIAQGMSAQRGNEIDEFVTDAVRNNLLGLPLDLASLNLTRGRDTLLPTLNQFRTANAGGLKPYTSWATFISALRHPESGINFIAAYGTHPSLKRVTLTNGTTVEITGATYTAPAITYTYIGQLALVAGQTATISGLGSGYDLTNAIVKTITPNGIIGGTFTVENFANHGSQETFVGSGVTLTAVTVTPPSPASVSGIGTIDRETTVSEKRDAAALIVNAAGYSPITNAVHSYALGDNTYTFTAANNFVAGENVAVSLVASPATCFNITGPVSATGLSTTSFQIKVTAADSGCTGYVANSKGKSGGVVQAVDAGTSGLTFPTDSADFYNSTGSWDPATAESGFNLVDLWLGGLAENPQTQPVAPPMLGPVFDKVFQDQMLKMQNGDRFYYLARFAGLNIGEEIPAQKFTDIVRRNTVSPVTNLTSTLAMGSPGFGFFDCAFGNTGNATNGASLFPAQDQLCTPLATNTPSAGFLAHIGLDNVIVSADPASANAAKLAGGGGDDSIMGGPGNDILLGGIGGDLMDGGAGDDILIGEGGDDLIKGGQGNDVINGAGISPAGTIADGGDGIDFIHKGGFSGVLGSFMGEAGNDFIQGSTDNDIILEGGEGNDWIEGLAGLDALIGDMGLNGGGGVSLFGGNDILLGQAGNDISSGEGGDDIFVLGDGIDFVTGGTGFNWADYAYNLRFDNGGASPSIHVDLSGFKPNPLNSPADVLIGVDGIAGSAGNDIIHTSTGSDTIVSGASGTVGTSILTFAGSYTTIVDGMQVSGIGIAPNAVTVGPATITTDPVTGLSTTTVDLTIPHTGTVSGSVKFNTWPLRDPSAVGNITGLVGLVAPATKTAGWNKSNTVTGTYQTVQTTPSGTVSGSYLTLPINDPSIQVGSTVAMTILTPTAFTWTATVTDYVGNVLKLSTAVTGTAPTDPAITYAATGVITPVSQWSGGNIILAGPGSDTIYVHGGSNVIDAKAYLNVGITAVAVAGGAYVTGADRNCGPVGATPCFSSMSLLAAAMDAGTVSPSGLTVVREIVTPVASGVDVVVFPNAQNLYTITSPATNVWDVTGPDGNTNRLINFAAATDKFAFNGNAAIVFAPATQVGVPVFTSAAPPSTVVVNTAYAPFKFVAAGATTVTASTLPAGMTFTPGLVAGTGTLAGTPTVVGPYPITITATNVAAGSATAVFTLVVSANALQLSPALQSISTTVGLPVSTSTFTPAGLTGTITYSISTAPGHGLTFDPTNGRISGTTNATLTKFGFTIRATGNGGATADAQVELTIGAAPTAPVTPPVISGGVPSGLTVTQLVPTIVWLNPATITTDQVLSSTQLNAVAKNPNTGDIVAGKFVYYPAAGEKLPASEPNTPRTLVVQFIPTETALFSNAVGTAKIVVTQATKSAGIVVSNSSLQVTYDGLPHEARVTSNTTASNLSISYNGFSTVPINAGTYTVEVKSNDPSYVGTASATLVIAKATPTVTWDPPATWNSADPVTDALLNASSSTMGTFTYSAALGSKFVAGTRAIKVVFDPKDSTNYNSVTVEKSVAVSASSTTTTKALALVLKGKFTATTTLSAKDKAALKKAAPSKAVIVTVSAYVAKGASKSADLTASRAKAAKVVSLLKKSAPKATYVIQAMGSTLNAACTAQKNECVLINIG